MCGRYTRFSAEQNKEIIEIIQQVQENIKIGEFIIYGYCTPIAAFALCLLWFL